MLVCTATIAHHTLARFRSQTAENAQPTVENKLGAFAEAVEEHEEEDGHDGVDERGDGQMCVEPGLRLREENAASQNDQALMHDKK